MKNPKIGERVRIYDRRITTTGVIAHIDGDYLDVDYKYDNEERTVVHIVDRRQCVRLVKKKRREWWIMMPRSAGTHHVVVDGVSDTFVMSPSEQTRFSHVIRVREVKKK